MLRVKVMLIGDTKVGKTCLTSKFCSETFLQEYVPTVAVDYKNKMNILDFSGNAEFFEVRNEFYKDSTAVFFVFDLTYKRTFDNLDQWYKEAAEFGTKETLYYLVGTNKDKSNLRVVTESDAQKWAAAKNCTYYEISSLNGKIYYNIKGTNIEELFQNLISKMND